MICNRDSFRFKESGDGHREYRRSLQRVETKFIGRGYDPDEGRDDEIISRGDLIEPSEHTNMRGIDADLFMTFTQRRCQHIAIPSIDSPARKRNLPAMVIQFFRSFRQHE